jgi:integrase
MAVAAYNIQWRSKPDAVGFRTARIKVKRGAKPHYKTVRVRTVREAHKIAAAFAADVDHGKAALAPARLLFSTFLDQWLAGLNVAPLTRINYTSAVNCHIKPALGSIALRSLSPLVIKQAFAGWVGKLKPSSLRQLRNVLASALKSAEKFDLISASPMRKLQGELPVGNPAKAVPVSADKITELLQDDTVYGVAVLLCVAAGLRRGEACGLQWRDIDFDLSTIRIERQLLPLLGPDGNELWAAKIEIWRSHDPTSCQGNGSFERSPKEGDGSSVALREAAGARNARGMFRSWISDRCQVADRLGWPSRDQAP